MENFIEKNIHKQLEVDRLTGPYTSCLSQYMLLTTAVLI